MIARVGIMAPFISAAGGDVVRIYERAGFRRETGILHISRAYDGRAALSISCPCDWRVDRAVASALPRKRGSAAEERPGSTGQGGG
jgi:hypothetical protein